MKVRIYTIYVILVALLLTAQAGRGQNYAASIREYRKQYIKDLLDEPRHPVKAGDERFLDFYEPDSVFRVVAQFTPTEGAKPFMIHTHSGKDKPFREFGVIRFTIHDTDGELHVYQMLDLVNNTVHQDELFVPFNDLTNYDFTFGGGRYIDLSAKDIKNGQIVVDFNKCYNPYCAFAEGFSCPIPPEENHLVLEIRAGEKMYKKFLGR